MPRVLIYKGGCHSGEPIHPQNTPHFAPPVKKKFHEEPVATSRVDSMGLRKLKSWRSAGSSRTFSVKRPPPKSVDLREFNVRSSPKRKIRAPKPGRSSHNMSYYNSKLQGTPWVVIWCDVVLMQLILGAEVLCIHSRAHSTDPKRYYCVCLIDIFTILRCWPQEYKRWAALHLHAAPPCSRGLDSRPRFLLHTSLIVVI